MSDELLKLTAAQQAERIAAGEISVGRSCSSCGAMRRESATTSASYLWVADEAPADAGTLPPVAVKDLFCVEGVPSMAGSRILAGYRPPYTATFVQRLIDAGAIVVGMTNMDEFAMGSSSGRTRPSARSRTRGIASACPAARAAAAPPPWRRGRAPWAIGTDTGGSIRQPASLCGIVGMKPTYGAVSRYGMIAFASSLDQCGPLTRDVTDAAILLRHLQGKDPCDSTSLGIPGEIPLPSAERLDGLRFGVGGWRSPASSPAWRKACAPRWPGSRSSAGA